MTSRRGSGRFAPPGRRRKLVYLDQKGLVHLAQVDTAHRHGTRYSTALQAARAARAAGAAAFPLSLTHYSDTLKITSVRRRNDLARLMEELSGFAAPPARRLTALYELEALDVRALPSGVPLRGKSGCSEEEVGSLA